jgi:hypothetical protein
MVAFKIIQVAACLSLAISGNAVSLRGRKLGHAGSIVNSGDVTVTSEGTVKSITNHGGTTAFQQRKLITGADCIKAGGKMEGTTCQGGAVMNFERKLITGADCIKAGGKMEGTTCQGGAVMNFERKLNRVV